MPWDPGPIKFWEGIYEHPRECFRVRDESRLEAQYMLKHPEIRALPSLVIAHMSRKPTTIVRSYKTLEETARFFTKPADVLQAEVGELLKKKGEIAKPHMKMKHDSRAIPRQASLPDCFCPHQNTPSVESFYSSFISKSTSATTIPSITEPELLTPTIEETVCQMILRGFNNALNTMYAARDHDIFYDQAYLCVTTCIQSAIEYFWLPLLADISDLLNNLLDDVRRISTEQRNLRKRTTDKVPYKVNRLKNNFKGFAESENYPSLRRKDILETLSCREGTFNRYPKDQFGVYCPNYDEDLDVSTTHEPPCDFEVEEQDSEVQDTLDNISLQNEILE